MLELRSPDRAFEQIEAHLHERGFFAAGGEHLVADLYLGYGLSEPLRRTAAPAPRIMVQSLALPLTENGSLAGWPWADGGGSRNAATREKIAERCARRRTSTGLNICIDQTWAARVEGDPTLRPVRATTRQCPQRPGQGRLEVHCRVLPEWGQLTQELWSFLMDRIRPLNPSVLLTRGREDWPEVLFYLRQGFVEEDRMWASTLDVFNFDPAPFLPQTSRALSSGISIRSLAERPYQDGDYRRRHYELLCQLLQDVPAAEPFVPWAFDLWVKRTFESPNFLPEGYFIAIDGEREVGISQLWASSRPQTLQTGLTGVLKEYRRRGIALLLKLRAAQFAKEKGFRFIRTNNHLANRPMLSINEAMGFVKEPAYVHLRKDLSAAYKPG